MRAALAVAVCAIGLAGSTAHATPPEEGAAAASPTRLPPEVARWVQEGIDHYGQGRYPKAAQAFEKARQLAPNDAEISDLLATSLLHANRQAAARQEFERHLGFDPGALSPRLGLARLAVRDGEFDVAERYYREVLGKAPADLTALYNLGWLRYRDGAYEESRDLLQRMVGLAPDNAPAHYTLGLALERLGDVGAAEAQLKQAVTLEPDNVRAHFNLMNLYARAGRDADAAREQEIYQGLADRFAADRAAEGTARDRYLAGDYPGALQEYERLLTLHPKSGRFELGRGLCLLKMGRDGEALATMERALSMDPRLPDAYFHLAALYQRLGQPEKARAARERYEDLETIREGKSGF
jgi:tetratricopeptide (TPR) repeat protein